MNNSIQLAASPSSDQNLPVWPADIPDGICRITDEGETVILSGRMIPSIRAIHRNGSNSDSPLIQHILTPVEPNWDAIRVRREHAPEVISILERIARTSLEPMASIAKEANYLGITAMAMTINYLSGAISGPGRKDNSGCSSPLAFVRINGPYLSISLANMGRCPLAEIVLRRHSVAGGSGNVSWCMDDVISVEDAGGTEIIYDLSTIPVSETIRSNVTSILYDVIDALVAYRLNPTSAPGGKTTTPKQQTPTLRVFAPIEEIERSSDEDGAISRLSISVIASDVTTHCLFLQALANQNIHCTIRSAWNVENYPFLTKPLHTATISLLAADLPAALDSMKPAISMITRINGDTLLLDKSRIPKPFWRGLATIHYDTVHCSLTISGLLIACERAEIIRIADRHRLSQSLTRAPSGDGYSIALDSMRHENTLESFISDVKWFLCQGANSTQASDLRQRTPLALLDIERDGIIQISHSAGYGSILIMRISHPDLCQAVRRDLIAMGWGWRAVNNSRSTRHDDETRLFLPEETTIEYLINTALPRTEILFQQAHETICNKITEDRNYGFDVPRSSSRSTNPTPTQAEGTAPDDFDNVSLDSIFLDTEDDEFSVQAGKRTPLQNKWGVVIKRFRRVCMIAPLLIIFLCLKLPIIINAVSGGLLMIAILWALVPCASFVWMYWTQKSRE